MTGPDQTGIRYLVCFIGRGFLFDKALPADGLENRLAKDLYA